MKYLLLLLCCLFSQISKGQIVNGSITLIFVDSVIPNLNQPDMGDREDTVVAIVDGKAEIHVISEKTKTQPYEISRDTVYFYFTDEVVVSNQKESDLYRLYDVKQFKSKNIIKSGEKCHITRKFNILTDFWSQEYATKAVLLKEKKCEIADSKISSRSEYYEIKSMQTHDTVSQVELCLTNDIKIPIKILFNYSNDELGCPLYLRKKQGQNLSEIRLLEYKELPKEIVLEKMTKEILSLLEDK